GMTARDARKSLEEAGVNEVAVTSDGEFDTGVVSSQDPPAGSVVLRGAGESLGVIGGQPFTPPPGPTAPASAAPRSLSPADPAADVPFIHWPQRGELVNTIAPLDAGVAWDVARGPHSNLRIVYAGSIDGMQGVILEGSGRMALLVRASPNAPFTVLDDRFVRQSGGLRQLSALGRPLLEDGTPAPYQIAFAVVHDGDVVSVKSPGLKAPASPSYAILARVPLSATRGNTSLVVTGGSTTVRVPLDPSSG
nr:PASTA domain-containing protein [Pseudonocardiales bacterium]